MERQHRQRLNGINGAKKILFTGDIYQEAQDVLTSNYTLGGHNVITAPHHGYGVNHAREANYKLQERREFIIELKR